MKNWIERYLYDVTRRLPEKEREDVGLELKANIYDMLSDNPEEPEIREVLTKLGPPALLAEKYRQKPRYLISPAIFDDYIRTLKWVAPLAVLLGFAIGGITGGIDAIKDGPADLSVFAWDIFSSGIDLGYTLGIHALFWVTFGFAVAEREGAAFGIKNPQDWKLEDLPEDLPSPKGRIPLSDGIAELVIILVFFVSAILGFSGVLPIAFTIQDGDTQILSLFSDSFAAACIFVLPVMMLLSLAVAVLKIVYRRWNLWVCGTSVLSSIAGNALLLWLLYRPEMFSAEFSAFLAARDWDNSSLLRFMEQGLVHPIRFIFAVVFVVTGLAECGYALVKTLKARGQNTANIPS